MDARFEEAPYSDEPIRLRAETEDDLVVIATLIQDAVLKVSGIHWMPRARKLVLLFHRFRWEDQNAAETQKRPYERVQSALTVNDVLKFRVRGINQSMRDAVLALLTLNLDPGDDGSGQLVLAMADGAELALEVECLNVTLGDLTQPWEAKSKSPPSHPD
ncbi:MAG: DUF2948 family protein [Pseudomonadota bacterium]